MSESADWLIYDGECAFCRSCVAWLERRDRQHRLKPAPFQEAPDPPLSPPLRLRAERSALVIRPDGQVKAGGRAILAALIAIGWHPRLAQVAGLPPFVWLVELGYTLVARNRGLVSRILFRRRCQACGR